MAKALPERKVISGVTWPFRATVWHRLKMAESANNVGVSWMGMSAVNRASAARDGYELDSPDHDPR